jgi:hypothetical protein
MCLRYKMFVGECSSCVSGICVKIIQSALNVFAQKADHLKMAANAQHI